MSITESGLEALRKKYGPFSGWTWGTIAAAGVGAYLLFFRKKGLSNDPNAIGQPITQAPPINTEPTGGGPGNIAPIPGPTVTTPPPDTYINSYGPNPAPATAPTPAGSPDGNYHIATPGGQLVTATPEAFGLKDPNAFAGYLKTVDQNAAIAQAVPSEDQGTNKAFADILNGQLAAGIIHPDQQISYGNNQHGTVTEAITFLEQNSAPQPIVSHPGVTGTPTAAGDTQKGY